MSDDTTSGAASSNDAEHPAPPTWPKSTEQDEHDALIFAQELNEVYLLIDYISGRGDRNLASLTMPNPNKGLAGEPDMLNSGEIVKRIAAMRYPPDPKTPVANAQNAAILLLAKDRLTALADPARGYTISYTKLFADAETAVPERSHLPRLRRRGAPEGGQMRSTRSPAAASSPPAAIGMPRPDTRVTIAARAFPGLQTHAQLFRRWRRRLVGFTIVWLFLTVLTYWDAGLARTVLQRLDQNWKSIATTEQANPELFDDPGCQSLSEFKRSAAPKGQASIQRIADDAKRAFACRTLATLHDENNAARTELDSIFDCRVTDIPILNFIHSIVHAWCWRSLILSGRVDWSGVPATSQDAEPAKPEQADETAPRGQANPTANLIDWQTATSVLSVFTTYILPMMFALLGTVIGAFRSILKRIRDSELEPRDLMRMHLGIPTGLVAGVAVGLFLSPSSVPSQGSGSVAGELTLTASGLGFLAGYASHGFFAYLDNIVGTVFPNTTAAAASPPQQAAVPAPVAATSG